MSTQEHKSGLEVIIKREADRQKDMVIKDLNKSIGTMYNAIMVDNYDMLSKIKEREFITHFLPYLIGLREDTDGRVLTNWIALARSVSSEVIVVSDHGEELFRVPPILDTSGILFKGKISQVMAKYAAYSTNPMYDAEGYINRNLKDGTVVENKRTFKNSWIDILKRYDLLDQFIVQETKDQSKYEKPPEDSDFLDYD